VPRTTLAFVSNKAWVKQFKTTIKQSNCMS